VTRAAIAADAGCSSALISFYFGTMVQLRRHIMRAAIQRQNLPIIAQGLAVGDPHARRAPEALKQAAIASIAV
jgi:hypothetical protein